MMVQAVGVKSPLSGEHNREPLSLPQKISPALRVDAAMI